MGVEKVVPAALEAPAEEVFRTVECLLHKYYCKVFMSSYSRAAAGLQTGLAARLDPAKLAVSFFPGRNDSNRCREFHPGWVPGKLAIKTNFYGSADRA